MKNIKLYLVDDQQMILDGLTSLLGEMHQIVILGFAKNGRELLDQLGRIEEQPDIILLDIEMPEMNGFVTLEKLKVTYPDIKVLALSSYNEKPLIEKMITSGAHGYIVKDDDRNILKDAIMTIAQGQKYFSSTVTISLAQTPQTSPPFESDLLLDDLTKREKEILKLIAEGFSNTEIGKKLFISHRTVDSHRTNLMKKIGVNNIAGLIRFAVKCHLTD